MQASPAGLEGPEALPSLSSLPQLLIPGMSASQNICFHIKPDAALTCPRAWHHEPPQSHSWPLTRGTLHLCFMEFSVRSAQLGQYLLPVQPHRRALWELNLEPQGHSHTEEKRGKEKLGNLQRSHKHLEWYQLRLKNRELGCQCHGLAN